VIEQNTSPVSAQLEMWLSVGKVKLQTGTQNRICKFHYGLQPVPKTPNAWRITTV
jgi:hypothetical protein